MRDFLNSVCQFMGKHYYFATFLMLAISIILIDFVGCRTNKNIANVQKVDSALMNHEIAYRDSIRKDSCLQAIASDRLDSLFNKWDSIFIIQQQNLNEAQEKLNKSQEDLKQNLTIWLSVIAAICTILPIVLGMNQNNSQRYQLELFNKEFEEKKKKLLGDIDAKNKKLKRKISKSVQKFNCTKDEVKKQVETHQSKLCHTEVISLLNMLSQNLNLLCNLQDIENKENPILTSPELVKSIIASLEANVNRCNSKFFDEKDKLDTSSLLAIQNALMSTACSIRDMIYLYENVFNGQKLLQIQRLRDELSFFILDKISTFKEASEDDVNGTFKQIIDTTKTLTTLFDSLGNG
jgi:hypothetical protein